MHDITSLSESQLDDPCYLKSITNLGDTLSIVTNRDIHSSSGIKLVNAGVRINSSLYERLQEHKLSPSLDQCLSVENAVTAQDLAEISATMLKENKRLSLIESTQFDGWKIPFVIKQVPLNPAIAFKLTIMRESRSELFHHSLYVAIISTYLGMKLRLEKHQLIHLATAALLHDIGILHVEPALLERDHKMTDMERRHLYVHPMTSWLVLKAYPEYTAEVLDAVLQHHEHMDGSGYPQGLKSSKIGQLAKILAVAEIVASRYSNEDVEHSWTRLETILKLNLRRYGGNLVRHLKVFYKGESEFSPSSELDKQIAREKESKIAAFFSSWDAARAQCDNVNTVCNFVAARMMNLKMEIIDAGLDPSSEEGFLDTHDDPQACFEAKILLDEALWQLYGIVQEIRRRWPSIDAENSTCDCGAVRTWLEEIESLS